MAHVKVPLADLGAQHASIRDELMPEVAALIEAQRFVLGEPVARFERELAAACGAAHAVGVASGTDAIELALRAVGVGPGDGVVTSGFSFIAAAEAIAAIGARPLFADIDLSTFCVSPASIEACLSRARATAIVPVHLFGRCADMEAIATIAKAHGLAVVEDAAQAIGARVGGRVAGSIGDAGALSFFPSKNLGAWGDGGAVVTSRKDVADRVRRLRAHGATAPYVHAEVGRNSRLDALQAIVLSVKLRHLDEWNAARAKVAARYRERLDDLAPEIALAEPSEGEVHNQLVIRSPRRDALAAHLAAAGIETRVYYPLSLPRQPCFASLGQAESCPRADEAARTALALPMYAELPMGAVDYVCDAIRAFV